MDIRQFRQAFHAGTPTRGFRSSVARPPAWTRRGNSLYPDRRARLVSAARCFRREAAEDRITGLAAEVAFYAVLGIFPGLLALAAALGFLGTVLGGDVAVLGVIGGFMTVLLWVYLLSLALLTGGEVNSVLLHNNGGADPRVRDQRPATPRVAGPDVSVAHSDSSFAPLAPVDGYLPPLGLLPEEIEPTTGAFLGNYPQAFSHVGLISSGMNLARLGGGR